MGNHIQLINWKSTFLELIVLAAAAEGRGFCEAMDLMRRGEHAFAAPAILASTSDSEVKHAFTSDFSVWVDHNFSKHIKFLPRGETCLDNMKPYHVTMNEYKNDTIIGEMLVCCFYFDVAG